MRLTERAPDGNVFRLPSSLQPGELFERLAGQDDVWVERIVSAGQATPPGEWLQQARDEWVLLIQGEAAIRFDDGSSVRLGPGDHVLIQEGVRHRVEWTRADPPCIWIAVHAEELAARPPERTDDE